MAIKTPANSKSASRVFVAFLRTADEAATAEDWKKRDKMIEGARLIQEYLELRSIFVQEEIGDWLPSDVRTHEVLESALHGL